MPPKKEQKSKEAKALAAMSASRAKGKKKKWAKGQVKEKKENAFVFTQNLYDRVCRDIPKTKNITVANTSERYQISGSLARKIIHILEREDKIKRVAHHSSFLLYTRVGAAEEQEE